MAKYKPGQFVKVCVLGRYRVNRVSKLEYPCKTCDIRWECCSYGMQGEHILGIPCSIAIGLHTNIKKVE
jgi:hypothetical protein